MEEIMTGSTARIKNIRSLKSLAGKNPIANENIVPHAWGRALTHKSQEDNSPEHMIESCNRFTGQNYVTKVAFVKERNMQGFLRFNPLREETSVIFLKRL